MAVGGSDRTIIKAQIPTALAGSHRTVLIIRLRHVIIIIIIILLIIQSSSSSRQLPSFASLCTPQAPALGPQAPPLKTSRYRNAIRNAVRNAIRNARKFWTQLNLAQNRVAGETGPQAFVIFLLGSKRSANLQVSVVVAESKGPSSYGWYPLHLIQLAYTCCQVSSFEE